MIYYREKEISKYAKLTDLRSGSMTSFALFHRTLHPYFSLFTHFDYRLKRLTRFSFVLGQWSLITLLLWISYSKVFDDAGITEWMDERRPFYVSLFLSLFTLPMPRRCCCFFFTEMYLLHKIDEEEDEDEEKQAMKNHQITDVDDEGPTSKRGNNAIATGGDDTEVKLNEYEN